MNEVDVLAKAFDIMDEIIAQLDFSISEEDVRKQIDALLNEWKGDDEITKAALKSAKEKLDSMSIDELEENHDLLI